MPITIFLSPSIHDDATVTALRKALEPRSVSVWADLQLLSAGDALTTRIQEAIREAQHFRADIEKFCKARRLIDLVPGHVVLGLLRRIVLLAVRRLAKIICPFLFSMCYDRLYAEPNKRDHCSKVYHFEAALG